MHINDFDAFQCISIHLMHICEYRNILANVEEYYTEYICKYFHKYEYS